MVGLGSSHCRIYSLTHTRSFLQTSLLVAMFEPLLCSLTKNSVNHRTGICDLTEEAF